MENLRWILLVAGIIFVIAIYLFGRQRRLNNSSDLFDPKEEVPDFSARDWDELDEGVGEVRIVARENDDIDFQDDYPVDQKLYGDEDTVVSEKNEPYVDLEQDTDSQISDDLFEQDDEVDHALEDTVDYASIEQAQEDEPEQKSSDVDIIVLYILARAPDLLTGDKINSAAQANGLVFGRMNIFHRLDDNGQTIFSLANMIEPGNFDPDTMHDIKTSGLTMFMQLSNLSSPSDGFDEMLRCAYHMSEMLGASLCNKNREPITQADAEYYRNLISEKENE